MDDSQMESIERARLAGIEMTPEQQELYVRSPDNQGEAPKGVEVPLGYKRCGSCGAVKKFYLFNKNNGSKTNTSGNCKECQKKTAAKSYDKTKSKRDYKGYYQANKERKQAHAKKYYEVNKDKLKITHKAYLASTRGQKVMRKAHMKRRKALAENKGIRYTRTQVLERDSIFLGFTHPICYLCSLPIEDTSGTGLHLDHIIPVNEDGLDCFTNVASAHSTCNLRREKDARKLTVEQINGIITRAEAYIDTYPHLFED